MARFDVIYLATHRRAVATISIGLLAAIVLGDLATGFELSLSSLYLVPVALITLGFGMRAGMSMALLAYGSWIGVNSAGALERSVTAYVFWEGGIRFATAGAFVILIDKLKRTMEREMRRSRRDPLTRLPNRRAFFEALDDALKRARRYRRSISIAYIDLDNFKQLNDTQGHHAGDRALRAVAATMLHHVRQVDVPARLGGDEFAVAYIETSAAAGLKAVNLLRDRLTEVSERHDWGVTFSIGLASFETVPDSVEAMIDAADHLMYEVKQHGKGSIRHQVY